MYVIECIPAPDGVPVAPCNTVGEVAMVPVVTALDAPPVLDYSGLGPLFEWAVSFVLIVFAIGVGIGAMVRVIRSA